MSLTTGQTPTLLVESGARPVACRTTESLAGSCAYAPNASSINSSSHWPLAFAGAIQTGYDSSIVPRPCFELSQSVDGGR